VPYLLLPGAGVRGRDDEVRVVRKFYQRIARVNCLQVGCRDGIRCRSDARPLKILADMLVVEDSSPLNAVA